MSLLTCAAFIAEDSTTLITLSGESDIEIDSNESDNNLQEPECSPLLLKCAKVCYLSYYPRDNEDNFSYIATDDSSRSTGFLIATMQRTGIPC